MSYVNIPSRFVSSDFYYSTYSANVSSTPDKTALWKTFIEQSFGENTKSQFMTFPNSTGGFSQKSIYDIMHAVGSNGAWPPAELITYKDYTYIEGMFASSLKSFFYDYAQDQANTPGGKKITDGGVMANYATYLQNPLREPVAKKQNTVLLWVWQVLLKILSETNKAAPTEGNYLLATTNSEDAAATEIQKISYSIQQSANDYAVQKTNIQLQTRAEVLRSQRASAGKQGQKAQSMITQLRDQATQQSQLMSTIIQTMEGLYQAILSKK
jgi:hypothetical protein